MRRLLNAYDRGLYDGAPLGFDGQEDGGRTLSDEHRVILQDCITFREHTEVHVRGVIFRSKRHRKLKTCNTGIMYPFLQPNGTAATAYGEILHIYEVLSDRLSPPHRSPTPPLIQVSWLTEQKTPFLFGRIPVVRRDPRSEWNQNQQYALIHKVLCWNVVFWPRVLRADRAAGEDLLAIFRYSKDKPTDR
jgi:hypothetical protein